MRSKIAPDAMIGLGDLPDWTIVRASQSPGPGAYQIKDEISDRIRGGVMSKGNPKSAEEPTALDHASSPAPDAYGLDLDKHTRVPSKGIKFSMGNQYTGMRPRDNRFLHAWTASSH